MIRNLNLKLDFRLFLEIVGEILKMKKPETLECFCIAAGDAAVFPATRQSVKDRLSAVLLPVFVWMFNFA